MTYNKHNIAVVAAAADKKSLHQELVSVRFSYTGTVATDSFQLIEISAPKSAEVKKFEPFMIRAEEVRGISSADSYDILDNKDKKYAKISVPGGTTYELKKMEGEFPRYESIFPDQEPKAEIKLNAKYLMNVVKVLSGLDPKKEVTLKFYGENRPIVIEAGNEDQKGRGLIAPILKK